MLQDEEEEALLTHHHCPCGNSSDAFALYPTHGYCFSHACKNEKKRFRKNELPKEMQEMLDQFDTTPVVQEEEYEENNSSGVSLSKGTFTDISKRKISKETCKLFNVTVNVQDGAELGHYYPYYNAEGQHVANKVRGRAKSFKWEGSSKGTVLFGQQSFGSSNALSTYQLLGSRYPVVSIKGGAGNALKDCKNNYNFLNSFKEIVICFDRDESGTQAANQVSKLFPNKSKVVTLDEGKDPSDYLMENRSADFTRRWYAAEKYTPANIIRGEDLLERLLNQPTPDSLELPWEALQDLTYGIRKGEMWTITSGAGMGKTQVLRELAFHIQQHTEDNIGLLFLEEPLEDAARGMMSLSAGKPLHLPTTEYTQEEWDNSFEDTLATGRYVFFDSFGSNDIDTIIDTIKYMRHACDCRYIFLDHISILVSDQSAGDERKALDEIATKLKTLTIELDIWLGMVSHSKRPAGKPHEEGGQTSLSELRGTAGIGQLSNMVIGLERNGQDTDLYRRNVTLIRVLKNRFSGLTGPACYLHYDRDTGRLTQIDDPATDTDTETEDFDEVL
jgi:twinkle protein